MRRIRIRHQTGFRYPAPITASYNEARMHPKDTAGQFVLSSRLDINPVTGRDSYVDYWGTQVTPFEVLSQHDSLSLRADSLVEVQPRAHLPGDLNWSDLDGIGDRSIELADQMFPTSHTHPPAEVAELAEQVKARSRTPAAAAHEICDLIGDRISYLRGVTEVSSTAEEVWDHQQGVCQDITHVALSALRAIGIPARYVSGYLQSRSAPEIGEPLAGESHAWVEWYCGAWSGYDPTNSLEISEGHVVVGVGRDYHDVAPLRGLYAGQSGADLFVEVTMIRQS